MRMTGALVYGVLSLAIAAGCASPSARAGATPRTTQIGHLGCGGARFTARTTWLNVPGHDRQPVQQTVQRDAAGSTPSRELRLDARPLRQPFVPDGIVLDAAVTGWACITATTGKAYLYLLYTCTQSTARPACAGDRREYVRLFDTTGKALNVGFPHAGPRTPALLHQLGLDGYLTDGVSLQDLDH